MESSSEPGERGPSGRWHEGWAAPALVFATSAAVLVIEILAGRLVAPYVGVSLETYTGIIGTVLAGIALGSWAGGRFADRIDPRRLLGPVLLASGVAALLAGPIISILGPGIAGAGGGPGGIVTLAVAAFVAPTALLSAISPMVAKLRLSSTAETGTVVGSLSAAGTAGALVGTFLTGFVLVAALPTRPILLGLGGALVLAGVAIGVGMGRRPPTAALAAAVAVAGLAAFTPAPCERETAYYCVSVLTDPARPSGRVLLLDDLRHSYVDLRDPLHLEFRYTQLFADVVDAALPERRVDALHIGGGGFTFPRWLIATRPAGRNTVLELDPEIVRIGREELGLRTGPRLQVRTGDARLNIADEPDDAYDLVIGDAFGGLSVPWHLTTREMVAEIARVLRADGLYVLNVIDGGPRGLVRAELATLGETFRHVALIGPPDGTTGNHVLVASDRPFSLPEVDPAEGEPITGAAVERFIGDARVLRDDFAPADQLLTPTR